jgi:dTDP-4-dehydrorhamnose 3,5-epimerase
MSANPVRLLQPRKFHDDRGWFSETYKESALHEIGIDAHFVQDNHSLSRSAHTLRGIHFQAPPHAQAKLIRCVRGCILDVAVDLRRGSPSFGSWVGKKLSAENGAQLYIPVGFGHGFLTLEPDCEVVYKVTDYYAPDCELGIRWNDPQVAIAWPGEVRAPVISLKDAELPLFGELDSPFVYDGSPLLPLAS